MKRLVNASVSTAIKFIEKPDFLDNFFNEYGFINYFEYDQEKDKLDFWNYNQMINDLYDYIQTQTRSKIQDVEEAMEVMGVQLKENLIDYLSDNEAKIKQQI